MLFTLMIILSTTEFVPIENFAALDAVAGPTDFGLMVIMSEDSSANNAMKIEVLESVQGLEANEGAEISLYTVTMNASGYSEIAALAGEYGGFPAVVCLVGHCGFLELDPEFIASEIEDSWYTWGDGSTGGICNYCKRCNP